MKTASALRAGVRGKYCGHEPDFILGTSTRTKSLNVRHRLRILSLRNIATLNQSPAVLFDYRGVEKIAEDVIKD